MSPSGDSDASVDGSLLDDGPAQANVARIGIDTHDEPVVYMRADSPVMRSEGFEALARVRLERDGRSLIAPVHIVASGLLRVDEVGLSESAWRRLAADEGEAVEVTHPEPVESLSFVRGKVYGTPLNRERAHAIIRDVVAGRYANTHLAAFITACAGDRLDLEETVHLTRAMVESGQRLSWDADVVVDKHSVGGLPGNRTTPIIVSIVAAAGLTMPKTSSRAITSPAGTADTMATVTNVDLTIEQMQEVVRRENGCMAWGGHVRLSPADDILIRVERSLDLDSEGQLVASVLSKKAAAGSTHVVLDMPVGETAKVRSEEAAETLADRLRSVGDEIGLSVDVVQTDGSQPVGRGIGPALEARNVIDVLRQDVAGPEDLKERALVLSGRVLEMGNKAAAGEGVEAARDVLTSGRAWEKFRSICQAQGGLQEPPVAEHTHAVRSQRAGVVASIDNRRLARVAKLAGAPQDPEAGLELHKPLGARVEEGDALFTVHADNKGELAYALQFVSSTDPILAIEPDA